VTDVFIDTSAFFAAVVATDEACGRVRVAFEHLRIERRSLVTTNYVITESLALLQRRVGVQAAEDLLLALRPVSVAWVGGRLHELGIDYWRRNHRRRLSFVDCVSFAFMRDEGIEEAVSVDADFAREGFRGIV
jgi:uncharacterized protein